MNIFHTASSTSVWQDYIECFVKCGVHLKRSLLGSITLFNLLIHHAAPNTDWFLSQQLSWMLFSIYQQQQHVLILISLDHHIQGCQSQHEGGPPRHPRSDQEGQQGFQQLLLRHGPVSHRLQRLLPLLLGAAPSWPHQVTTAISRCLWF